MKSLSLLVALLAVSVANATDLPLNETGCTNYICFSPAPGISYVGTDSTYSSELTMSNGVLFSGPTTSLSQSAGSGEAIITLSAELHSADGRTLILTATFRKWVTVVNSGRLHTRKTNIELLSGTISS